MVVSNTNVCKFNSKIQLIKFTFKVFYKPKSKTLTYLQVCAFFEHVALNDS